MHISLSAHKPECACKPECANKPECAHKPDCAHKPERVYKPDCAHKPECAHKPGCVHLHMYVEMPTEVKGTSPESLQLELQAGVSCLWVPGTVGT